MTWAAIEIEEVTRNVISSVAWIVKKAVMETTIKMVRGTATETATGRAIGAATGT